MSRRTQHLNRNRQFMAGIFILTVAVFFVVGFFLVMCYDKAEQLARLRKEYRIELARGFVGDSLQVALNDSVLFEGTIATDSMVWLMPRLDDQHVLMVGDLRTGMAKMMNINIEEGRIVLDKDAENKDIHKKEIPAEK